MVQNPGRMRCTRKAPAAAGPNRGTHINNGAGGATNSLTGGPPVQHTP